MLKLKQKKNFDGIDQERFGGVFLPLNTNAQISRKKPQNIKEFIMENIETVLDEIMGDIEDGKNK